MWAFVDEMPEGGGNTNGATIVAGSAAIVFAVVLALGGGEADEGGADELAEAVPAGPVRPWPGG